MDSTLALRSPVMQIGLAPAGDAYDIVPMSTASRLIVAASIGLSAFHGYRRNQSVGWAIWWALMGGLFPIVTPAIAFAQGFGKRASSASRGSVLI